MLAARISPSILRLLLAMACVLGMQSPGYGQNPPSAAKVAKPSGNASSHRRDPALKVKLTVDFKSPKAQEIVGRLRAETKMDLTLADNIDQTRPALGSLSCRNVPAFIIMDELAKSKIIQGKWERSGAGYVLTSPLPAPVRAEAKSSEAPSPEGPTKLGLQYFLFAIPILAVFGVLLLVRYWRRSRQSLADSKESVAAKLPPSGVSNLNILTTVSTGFARVKRKFDGQDRKPTAKGIEPRRNDASGDYYPCRGVVSGPARNLHRTQR